MLWTLEVGIIDQFNLVVKHTSLLNLAVINEDSKQWNARPHCLILYREGLGTSL